MTVRVNETVKSLADSVRRYVAGTAARHRIEGKYTRPDWEKLGTMLSRRTEQLRQQAQVLTTPAHKTTALGAGASLLITGMVFGVAEAAVTEAPQTVAERQLVNSRPLGQDPAEPAEAVPAQPPAEDGAGSTAPVAQEAPAKPSVPLDTLTITSPFGWRINPMTGSGQEWHTGTDFRGPTGTHVKAARGGTVTEAGWHTTGGGGLRIVVDHGDGVETTYNHLNDIWVEPGQWVDEAQVIGAVGSTGNSTGPHLHFEVIINGDFIDPMTWL